MSLIKSIFRKNKNGLVSVILPAYNEEERLPQMMDSLLGQTYNKIEIIIVDDGSTDDTYKLCQEYSKRDERVKLYSQKNSGCDCARNLALRHAEGEFVMFADGDDFYEKDAIEILMRKIRKERLDVVNYNAKCFYDDITEDETDIKPNRYIKKHGKDYEKKIVRGCEYFEELRKNGDFSSVVWAFIVRKKIIDKHNLRFMHVPTCRHGDVLFSFECLYYAKRVSFVNETLYNRRVRSGSITNSKKDIRDVYSYYYIIQKLRRKYVNGNVAITQFVKDIEGMNEAIFRKIKEESKKVKNPFKDDRGFVAYIAKLQEEPKT